MEHHASSVNAPERLRAFFESCRFGPEPAAFGDPNVRSQLVAAIRERSPQRFREVLTQSCPELVGQPHLYIVMEKNAEGGLGPIVVNENGALIGRDCIIGAGTPMSYLNIEFAKAGFNVVLGDERWFVPLDQPNVSPERARKGDR